MEKKLAQWLREREANSKQCVQAYDGCMRAEWEGDAAYFAEAARMAEAFPEMLAAMKVLLDHVDYTSGACRATEMVAGVLPAQTIKQAYAAIAAGEAATGPDAKEKP